MVNLSAQGYDQTRKHGSDEQDDQRKRHCDVFEEVAVVAHYLSSLGLLEKIVLEVRFSRKLLADL
jgi:hypothetical protein